MNATHDPARPKSTSITGYAITPVGPDDRAALCDLFRRSSVDTRYARFHHMVADFPHHYLADVTCTRCPHLALAARLPEGDMIGLASAGITDPDTAEIAVWVRDDWQHRHVGTTLVTDLLNRLAKAGLTSATAIVSTTNTGARALVQRLAPHATTRRLDLATVEVRIPLDRPGSAGRRPRARTRRAVQLASLLTGGLLVLAGCALAAPTSPTAATAAEDELNPLIISAPSPDPIPVKGTDERYHVAYELTVLNAAPRAAVLTAVDTLAADHTLLGHVEGDELVARTQLVGAADRTPAPVTSLPAGATAVLLLDDRYPSSSAVPTDVTHRIEATFAPARDDQVPLAAAYPDRVNQDGGNIHIARREPIVIGPPLQGDDWVALNACCTVSHHRGSLLPLDGRINATERYAIDWVRFDLTAPTLMDLERGEIATYSGDPTRAESYRAYNQPVLAVADATVVAVTADMPDTPPRTVFTGTRLDHYGGNHIVLDLGDGHYAFYAHLKPNSASVRVGDHVRKGQQLARIGNSGNSTEPHLHFHLTTTPLPYTGDNIPYEIDHTQYLGTVTPTGLADTPARGERTNQLPLAFSAAAFPATSAP
jgi:hypothetical protein